MYKLINFLFIFLIGCAGQRPLTTSNNNSNGYSEDLSIHRPKVKTEQTNTVKGTEQTTRDKKEYVPSQYSVNKKLDVVLDSIDAQYQQRKYVEGYTIQIFTGEKNGALEAKRQLALNLPDLYSEIDYDAPTFRVRVGYYHRQLDAQKDFVAIKQYFPSAILVPQKIGLN